MRYVLTADEMRSAEYEIFTKAGIPSLVLMERAAYAVVQELLSGDYDLRDVLCVCGTGNNGADACAVARMLKAKGIHASALVAGDSARLGDQAKIQIQAAEYYQVPMLTEFPENAPTLIVDGLFGIGCSRDLSGAFLEAVEKINAYETTVVSVDIPSGIHTDTGKVMKAAVKADVTVTFSYEKAGLLLYPGAEYAGTVKIADLMIPGNVFGDAPPSMKTIEKKDVREMLFRKAHSHKGTYGKILIVAGHEDVAGAAYLAAAAAYRTGAGLVKIFTERSNREILLKLLPEAMITSYNEQKKNTEKIKEKLMKDLSWADAVVAGPGIGLDETARLLTETVLREFQGPIVLDADSITLAAKEEELISLIGENCVLTPHPAEMSRLCKAPVSEVVENLSGAAKALADRLSCVILLKDAHTVIADKEGCVFVNLTGCDGMAVGGSGDVLTGVIAALLARNKQKPLILSAAAGAYLHGTAGEKAAKKLGKNAMLSSDLLEGLCKALKDIE